MSTRHGLSESLGGCTLPTRQADCGIRSQVSPNRRPGKGSGLVMTTVPKLLSIAIVGAIGAFAVLPPKIEPVNCLRSAAPIGYDSRAE